MLQSRNWVYRLLEIPTDPDTHLVTLHDRDNG